MLAALGAVALVVLFGLAFSWISATLGLFIGDAESAQALGFVWVFPLVFASSVFVPVETMPGWLRSFTEVNPITAVVDATRGLVLGGGFGGPVWPALAWTFGIIVVFAPLAVWRYRRMS